MKEDYKEKIIQLINEVDDVAYLRYVYILLTEMVNKKEWGESLLFFIVYNMRKHLLKQFPFVFIKSCQSRHESVLKWIGFIGKQI